ncbi:MAG: sugar ABC transporter substrate-binding protein [Leifsonia xyli]|nr:MAG: sugar ABC transporter substrate-binding protein [Leifsonia xyli]
MTHRRALAVAAAVAATGLILAGCSADSGEGGGGVTLTLWHNTQDPEAILNVYKAYEEASGNKIELVPISSDGFEDATLTKWASGDRPDILEFHATQAYITMLNPAENLQDLSDMAFVAKSGSLYDLGGRGADGKVYAAITNFPEVWGLYYSKSVLDQFGLEPATTADELLEQCKVLSAAGVPTLAESGASLWPPVAVPFMAAATSTPDGWVQEILDQETTLDAPDSPVLGGLEYYKELLDAGCMNKDITTATFETSVAAVYGGTAAYQAIHSNIAPVYLDAAGGDAEALGAAVGFTAFAMDEPMTVINPGPIGSYLLPKTGDSAKEQAAREFIEFATGEHYASYIEESGTFPVIEGVADPTTATPVLLDIKAAYDQGPIVGMQTANLPGGLGGVIPLMSELIVGQTSPQDMAATLQSQLATAAKAQGLEGW